MSSIDTILLGRLVGETKLESSEQRQSQSDEIRRLNVMWAERAQSRIYQEAYAEAYRHVHGKVVEEMSRLSYGNDKTPFLSDPKNKDARGALFAQIAVKEVNRLSNGQMSVSRLSEENLRERFKSRIE